MRERWNNLSLRDKRMAFFGISLIIVFVFYVSIWQPLSTKNELLRSQIKHNKQLLVWMKAANQRIKSLQTKSPKLSSHSNVSILSIVQEEIQDSALAGKFSELKQAEIDSVRLNFQAVNFDDLISWLTKMGQEQGVIITQISITPSSTTGAVTANMILKKA